jgi:hypothetical protein
MNEIIKNILRRLAVLAMAGAVVPLPLLWAQPQDKAPPSAPAPSGPAVSIVLKDRHGHANAERSGSTHTGGGNTDVAQPKDDTIIITTAGVAVAGPHPCCASSAAMNFDLTQNIEVVFGDKMVKKAMLTVDAQIVGLLRGDKHGGSASVCNGAAQVSAAGLSILALAIEGHSVAGGDNLSINDHKGPVRAPVLAGEHSIYQTFRISAAHTQCLWGKAASAEFAPDPALDPLWISYWEPYHGANKKDFGFKVTYHIEPE